MRTIAIAVLLLAACASDRPLLSGDDVQTSTSTSSSGSSTAPPADGSSSGVHETGSSTTTSAESSSSSGDDPRGCPFVCGPDLGDAIIEDCDLWAQDCPLGQKCMPWANDGGNAWNATRCSPIADEPAHRGEPCTTVGYGVAGIDSCDRDTMCWNVDETNTGTCVDFCLGSERDPICLDAFSQCIVANDGFLVLCLPICDPRLQDCREGEACFPAYGVFTCAPDAGQLGLYADPCEFINICDPGLFCDESESAPDCTSSIGCCNYFCDLADDDPDAVCPDAAQGQTCVPWFEPGEAPPGFATLGRCALP